MPSKREQVLSAFFERLKTLPDIKALRNEPLPERVPNGGLVILRDGAPGEPSQTLSPPSYLWEHSATIEVVTAKDDAALDALLVAIGGIIAADRTLGGLCDFIQPGAPQTGETALDGAGPFKGAIVPVLLVYTSDDPLL